MFILREYELSSVSADGRDGGRMTAGINGSAFVIVKPLNIFNKIFPAMFVVTKPSTSSQKT